MVGGGSGTPLLLLHGGPGFPSYYLEPLAALSDERPVIFYDQLGAGRSDRPSDNSLWTTERFVREVAQVREALGLREIHLYGHSWGSMLATDYMMTKPSGVKSLLLAGPALSAERWMQDAGKLKLALSESSQAAIIKHEAEGTTDSPEYQAAMLEYYKLYLCRRDPWPPELEKTNAEIGFDVYFTMWGPSEFRATGLLKSYDRTPQLGSLQLPVLFTAGRYDEATPATTEYYRSLVPGARLHIFEDSAHLSMLDEPEENVRVIRNFLRSVEQR
jgi:proline iminopeptidase